MSSGATCFGLLASNPRVCSGNGNCTYYNFCNCFGGYDGLECQALAAVDIRDVMFGVSITGPILAVFISILLCIPFNVYICRRRKAEKEEKKRKEQEKKLNQENGDKVVTYSVIDVDQQRSPKVPYSKPRPFTSSGEKSNESLVTSPRKKATREESQANLINATAALNSPRGDPSQTTDFITTEPSQTTVTISHPNTPRNVSVENEVKFSDPKATNSILENKETSDNDDAYMTQLNQV